MRKPSSTALSKLQSASFARPPLPNFTRVATASFYRTTRSFTSQSVNSARKNLWKMQNRSYCDDALDKIDISEAPQTIEFAEPLVWSDAASLPNLLSEPQISQFSRGVDINRALDTAKTNIKNLLRSSFSIDSGENRILVVYDTHCLLTRILAQAYGSVLKSGNTLMVDFDQSTVPQLKATIDTMTKGDLVVLVQSNGFRLNDYRLRIELFKVGISNLEHSHLDMMPNSQIQTYIDTLEFTPQGDNRRTADTLKQLMDSESHFVVRSKGGVECVYDCKLEPSLLNIADYTGMKGVGGTFPVGEVFSEPSELSKVNGEFMVFGFPSITFDMQFMVEPFKIVIREGKLVDAVNPPAAFNEILSAIRGTESEDEDGGILIREFGVGINTAIGRDRPLQNVTAFERQAGFHISLGRKHTVFKKSGISHKRSRFHIDVFIDVDEIQMGQKVVFKNGAFTL